MLLNCGTCKKDYFEGELNEWECPVCKKTCYPVTAEFSKEGRFVLPRENLPPYKCERDEENPEDPMLFVGRAGTGGGAWGMSSKEAHFIIQSLLQQALNKHKSYYATNNMLTSLEYEIQFILSQAVRNAWYILVPKAHLESLDELDATREVDLDEPIPYRPSRP